MTRTVHHFYTLSIASMLGLLLITACGQGPRPLPATQPPVKPSETLPPPATPTSAAPPLPTATLQPSRTPVSAAEATGTQHISAFFRSGQTFLTWDELADQQGEVYRVYRASTPIDANSIAQAQFLAQMGKNSARFYANRYVDNTWGPRITDRLILGLGEEALPEGKGLLVWTLANVDFDGQANGQGYYAVTYTPAGGAETFSSDYTFGPIDEAVQDPLPVETTNSPNVHPGPGGHFYIQYMDLRSWNPTFHAPNESNLYLGLDPNDPEVANALAYAYDYSVFEPTEEMCGGQVPDTLPVMVYLHGWRGNRYPTPHRYDNPSCAYGVYPIDESQTWYFGFARNHDYRKGGPVAAGDVIVNYTEQRVLRMVYDLLRNPPGPTPDPQRVYLIGHSMGGTGALAFAQRYPNVFAATYAGQPMTNFRTSTPATQDWLTDVAIKWGAPELNLPIWISAPGGWAAHLQKYNGQVGVWDWQDYQASFLPEGAPGSIPGRATDEMAPFGVDHGSQDFVIPYATQAQPFYPILNSSGRTWGGAVWDAEHAWSAYGYLPPTLTKVDGMPFWHYQVIKNETVPGVSRMSSNDPNPPGGPTRYNQTIKWSASWDAFNGAPVDQPDRWQMSFCAVEAGSQACGSGPAQTVDITPRRLQQFKVVPNASYAWENVRLNDGSVMASGTVTASAAGLITVPGIEISPEGNQLTIKPAQ